jgi:hypothetical protein
MKRSTFGWPALALSLMIPICGEAAQETEKIEIQPRFSGLYHANFLQAKDGAPKTNVWANVVEVRFLRKLDEYRKGLQVYGLADQTTYSAFDASRLLGAGLELRDRPHSLRLYARRRFKRPAFFIGDELDTYGIFRVNGEYAHRLTREYELKGLFDYYRQSYDMTKGLNNKTLFWGGAVRYRGFGYRFSPELGFRRGRQDTADDHGDYSQKELLVTVRSVATPTIYLSVRYRYRSRNYDTTLPGSRNFERHDSRHAVRALATIRTGELLLWDVYFSRENADSLRLTRIFITTTFGLGVRLLL